MKAIILASYSVDELDLWIESSRFTGLQLELLISTLGFVSLLRGGLFGEGNVKGRSFIWVFESRIGLL